MAKLKEVKKQNPYARINRVIYRTNNEEMQIITEKAWLYFDGDISKYCRFAAVNFRPHRKVQK